MGHTGGVRVSLWPVVAAALTALAACSTSAASAVAPVGTGPAPTAAPSPTAYQSVPAKRPGTITLAFGGDVNFEGHLAHLLDGADGLGELRATLGAADVSVVNLETAITDRGSPEAKIYHFRTSPKALATLAAAGVDVVTMANNHTVDFGPDGLIDTLAARDASPIPVVGIGRNAADAFAPAVVTVEGLSVAVIGSSQVNDLTVTKYPASDTTAGIAGNLRNDRLVAAVTAARSRYDLVVVYLHWGTDYTSCPDGAQTATATALAAAGADVVVGSHAHRVQGGGWLGRAYVDYGLGNFIWLNTRGEPDTRSGVLTVTVDIAAARAQAGMPIAQRAKAGPLVVGAVFTPMRVSDNDGLPRVPADAAALAASWDQARGCARLRPTP
jgi:poly-gamma-glutamate synthesis protein (capsule biosynthesis protein)